MTKQDLLRNYDALMLCAENGKYGETKETVRKWLDMAIEVCLIEERRKWYEKGREYQRGFSNTTL